MQDARAHGHGRHGQGGQDEACLVAGAHGLATDAELLLPLAGPPRDGGIQDDLPLLVVGVEPEGVDVRAHQLLIQVLVFGLVHLKVGIRNCVAVLAVRVVVAVRGRGLEVLLALSGELVQNRAHGLDTFLRAVDLLLVVPFFRGL